MNKYHEKIFRRCVTITHLKQGGAELGSHRSTSVRIYQRADSRSLSDSAAEKTSGAVPGAYLWIGLLQQNALHG